MLVALVEDFLMLFVFHCGFWTNGFVHIGQLVGFILRLGETPAGVKGPRMNVHLTWPTCKQKPIISIR